MVVKKKGEPKAPLKLAEFIVGLEGQPQSKLDVATFVGWLPRNTIDAALLSLDKGSAERTNIYVLGGHVQVMVIENVVKLAAELQAEPLGELESLIEIHVGVPEVWPQELVPLRV